MDFPMYIVTMFKTLLSINGLLLGVRVIIQGPHVLNFIYGVYDDKKNQIPYRNLKLQIM